jgi:predicted esterase YcpF (UPF0227 family)
MVNVLYIHGLASSSESSTGKFLRLLSNDKITFHNPSFSLSPKKAIEEVNTFIKEHNIDIVVGSSLGGFYALQSDCHYGVVINPALTPVDDLKNSIGLGEHQYRHSDDAYILDENFLEELEYVIRRNYKGDDINDWYKSIKDKVTFGGIFGAKDELFSHYDDFHIINSDLVILIGDMEHSFDVRYKDILLSFIEEILKRKNK